MAALVLDSYAEAAMIADRKARGIDQYDEVWEGTEMSQRGGEKTWSV